MINVLKKHKIKNEFFISIVAKIMFISISFVNSILLARVLGRENLGQFTYITNVSTVVSMVIGLGIGESYSYFKKKYGEEIRNKYINIIYVISVFYLPILFITYNTVLFIIVFIALIQQLNTQIIYIALIDNANKKNMLQIVTNLLYIFLLGIASLLPGISLKLILCIYIAKTVFNTIILMTSMNILPTRTKVSFEDIKQVITFGIFPMINSLLSLINYKIDIVILTLFLDFNSVGLYSIGITLGNMLWIIPDAFKDILFKRTSKTDCIDDILFSIKLNVLFCSLIILGFSIFGRFFLKIVYGAEYVASYPIVILLFIGGIPMIYYKLINTLYISLGKQKFTFFILLSSALANIILNFILIPYYGIFGAAFSSVASYSICGIIYIFKFKTDFKLKIGDIFIFSKNEYSRIRNILN